MRMRARPIGCLHPNLESSSRVVVSVNKGCSALIVNESTQSFVFDNVVFSLIYFLNLETTLGVAVGHAILVVFIHVWAGLELQTLDARLKFFTFAWARRAVFAVF